MAGGLNLTRTYIYFYDPHLTLYFKTASDKDKDKGSKIWDNKTS